jgi:hypothetical protein
VDEIRRLRFQVAPLLFIASLGWGMWMDPVWRPTIASLFAGSSEHPEKSIGQAITILAGGGIVVFTMGLVIGTFSYVILRSVFYIDGKCRGLEGVNTHEVFLAGHTLSQIREKLNPSMRLAPIQDFYAAVTFDHGILQTRNPGVYHWMVRRWNAFSISVTSISGLMLSLIVGFLFCIHISYKWLIPVIILLVIFSVTAIYAWLDTMRMLAFQATLPIPDPAKK